MRRARDRCREAPRRGRSTGSCPTGARRRDDRRGVDDAMPAASARGRVVPARRAPCSCARCTARASSRSTRRAARTRSPSRRAADAAVTRERRASRSPCARRTACPCCSPTARGTVVARRARRLARPRRRRARGDACARWASRRDDVVAWIGPAIGPRALRGRRDVYDAFVGADAGDAACFAPHRDGKWLADLPALARRRLARAGVQGVAGGTWCTVEDAARFYSWRRDRGTGRMATAVAIEKRPAEAGPRVAASSRVRLQPDAFDSPRILAACRPSPSSSSPRSPAACCRRSSRPRSRSRSAPAWISRLVSLRRRRAARRGVPRARAARARDRRRAPGDGRRCSPACSRSSCSRSSCCGATPRPRAHDDARDETEHDHALHAQGRPGPLGPHDPDRQQRPQLLRRRRDRRGVSRRHGARRRHDASRSSRTRCRSRSATSRCCVHSGYTRAARVRRTTSRPGSRRWPARSPAYFALADMQQALPTVLAHRGGEPALRRRRRPDPEPAPAARAARDREAVTADRGGHRRHRRRARAAARTERVAAPRVARSRRSLIHA